MPDRTCASQCKAELSCSYFGFDLTDMLVTDRSTDWKIAFGGNGVFGGERKKLLIWKGFSALLMTIILVWSLIDWVESYGGDGTPATAGYSPDDDVNPNDVDTYIPAHTDTEAFGYWPIKVTHWTLTVQVLYLWLSTYTIFVATLPEDESLAQSGPMPFFVKATWYFHAVTLPATFFVFFLYWGLVFDGTIYAVSISTHGVNFVVQLLDSFITRMPYRLIHGLFFLFYMLTYIIFTLLYYAGGGHNETGKAYVYAALDWGGYPKGTAILVVIICFVLVPVIHTCFWSCKHYAANSARSKMAAGSTPAAL
jgi:hypothetical protein